MCAGGGGHFQAAEIEEKGNTNPKGWRSSSCIKALGSTQRSERRNMKQWRFRGDLSQLRELADSYTSHLPDSSPTSPRLQLCFLPASLSFYGEKTSGGLKRRAQELGDLSLVRLYRQLGKEHSCSQLGSALLFPTWVSPLSLAIFCIAWVFLVQHQGERRNGLPARSLSRSFPASF